MKTFCSRCGAEKYVNGKPGVKDADDSHGICPVCIVRVEFFNIKKSDSSNSEPEKIIEDDELDLKDEFRKLLKENAEWIGKDGVPVLNKDPELKEIYEKLKAEVIAERSSEGTRK